MAIYGRIFALSTHLAQSLSLDLERILAGQSGVEELKPQTQSVLLPDTIEILEIPLETNDGPSRAGARSGFDMGQKIARPVPSTPNIVPDPMTVSKPTPTTSPERQSPSEVARTPSPSPAASPSMLMEQDSPDPDYPDGTIPQAESSPPVSKLPRERTTKVLKKKRVPVEARTSEISKKKKKRNDIDDIFGF